MRKVIEADTDGNGESNNYTCDFKDNGLSNIHEYIEKFKEYRSAMIAA